MTMKTAWHYTRGEHLLSILVTGQLNPATKHISPHEKPAVWFSLSPEFEPTALPGIVSSAGRRRTASVSEAFVHGRGLYRFGIDASLLLSGEELRRAARIPTAVWQRLCLAGRNAGADPRNWLGHIGPVLVSDLQLQRLTQVGGEWIDQPINEVATA